MSRTNPHQARVEHLLGVSRISRRAGLDASADRFLGIAAGILDTRRVPNAATYRAQIANHGKEAA